MEDGRIVSVCEVSNGPGELVELGDRWLVPGYIDVHVHGGGGAQCNTSETDEVAAVARFHARHGTTALLATTAPAPMEELCAALAAIARCPEPNLLGAHLEGPFLSRARPGAMAPLLPSRPRSRAELVDDINTASSTGIPRNRTAFCTAASIVRVLPAIASLPVSTARPPVTVTVRPPSR